MRLTLHPQGRHRPLKPTTLELSVSPQSEGVLRKPVAQAADAPASEMRWHAHLLVETWEQVRCNYTPPTLSRREWIASLWAAIAGRNTVDLYPDTVGRDQQGEPWQSLTGSPPKQGHASNSR
jgi:hypothetical protein